jgi:anti-sigma B factor antagonist
MTLKVTSRVVEDILILDLSGRITQGEGAETLHDSIRRALEEGHKKILLNLWDVHYIDSTGIGVLVSSFTRVKIQGGEMKLLSLTQKVHDLLQITKLYTVFDVRDDESSALAGFSVTSLYCCCPLCGETSGPPVIASRFTIWAPQACRNRRCEATFTAVTTKVPANTVATSMRIQTYKDEHFDVVSGHPFTVKIVGRLDLFSSAALSKSWQVLPYPRRVLFDLSKATEIDDAGWEALVTLLKKGERDAKAAVSLQDLSAEQVSMYSVEPPFYRDNATALAALGDVSDTPSIQVKVVTAQSK